MKKYLAFLKNSLMMITVYRTHFFFMVISNILYITLTYFLWKSIYKNSGGVLNGMTFADAFIYLSFAMSIFMAFKTFTEWEISRNIISGNIVVHLLKPIDFQLMNLARNFGFVFSNLITITIPSFLIVIFVFNAGLQFGLNILLFSFSFLLAFLISFNIDYCIGLTSFYTESIWGISMTKEIIVLLLSGAVIPFDFFPSYLKSILRFLPFQAIYNIPLTILVSTDLSFTELINMFLVQIFWIFILFFITRLFFKKAIKILTVNGG